MTGKCDSNGRRYFNLQIPLCQNGAWFPSFAVTSRRIQADRFIQIVHSASGPAVAKCNYVTDTIGNRAFCLPRLRVHQVVLGFAAGAGVSKLWLVRERWGKCRVHRNAVKCKTELLPLFTGFAFEHTFRRGANHTHVNNKINVSFYPQWGHLVQGKPS